MSLFIPKITHARDIDLPETGLPDSSLLDVGENFVYYIVFFFVSLAVLAFMIAGILYVTSSGNEDRAQQAKRTMIYAIIGLVIGALAFVIIYTVENTLFDGGGGGGPLPPLGPPPINI